MWKLNQCMNTISQKPSRVNIRLKKSVPARKRGTLDLTLYNKYLITFEKIDLGGKFG